MMAVYDFMKYATVLLTVLVCTCLAEEEKLSVNNVNTDEHLDKRSAEHFWKRDTEKSLESFWKRAADHGYPGHEYIDSAEEAEKRRVQFLGKRRVQFLGKRDGQFDEDDYFMDEDLDDMDKRARQAFLGKRARQAFLGKRARQAFLGKRSRQAFLGKRADQDAEAFFDDFDEYNDDDLDKRARQAFLGKRARQAFLGKRSDYEDADYNKLPYGYKRHSYLGKRPRLAFLGKRAYEELEDSEDKRARQAFLGKRSADEQPETSA